MNRKHFFSGKAIGLLIVLVMLGVAVSFFALQRQPLADYRDAEYTVEGEQVRLTGNTKYFGNELRTDLDGDGRDDVVFLITQDKGGSGTFYYVVAALNTRRGYIGSAGLFLGDRIAPQTMEKGVANEVIVNYADRAPTDPFTVPPSIGKSARLIFDLKTLRFKKVDWQPFSVSVPDGYTKGETDRGTKFTIPASLAAGTNLSTDSYVSVEQIPQASECSASAFISLGTPPQKVIEGQVTYSVSTTTDAAAGNRYEETIYAILGSNPCTAVRYFIHYGVFENYPEGSIKEFDKAALLREFDRIRSTLVVNQ